LTARRSVLSIQNFNSAVKTALTDPRARGETFIVSDPMPVSVSYLIARYRTSLGRSPFLVKIPERWLELSLTAVGQSAIWERIGRPLVARPSKLRGLHGTGFCVRNCGTNRFQSGATHCIQAGIGGGNSSFHVSLARSPPLPYLTSRK
jgi:hypothetical protein